MCTWRKSSTSQDMSKLRNCQKLKHQGQGQENKNSKTTSQQIKNIKTFKNKSMLLIKFIQLFQPEIHSSLLKVS